MKDRNKQAAELVTNMTVGFTLEGVVGVAYLGGVGLKRLK